jgi:hypothetical protein
LARPDNSSIASGTISVPTLKKLPDMNTFLIAYFFLCLGGLIGWLARHAVAREQAASGENEGIFEHQRQQAVPVAASAEGC